MTEKPTQKQVAAEIDLSVRQVQRLIVDGVLDMKASLQENRIRYIRYLRAALNGPRQGQASSEDDEPVEGSLEFERIRLTRAQAEAQELKNEVARGELAPIELIERVLSAAAAEAAGILDSLPLTIKRKHPQLDSQIIESIKRQTVKAMNAIAKSELDIDRVFDEYMRSLAEA